MDTAGLLANILKGMNRSDGNDDASPRLEGDLLAVTDEEEFTRYHVKNFDLRLVRVQRRTDLRRHIFSEPGELAVRMAGGSDAGYVEFHSVVSKSGRFSQPGY